MVALKLKKFKTFWCGGVVVVDLHEVVEVLWLLWIQNQNLAMWWWCGGGVVVVWWWCVGSNIINELTNSHVTVVTWIF